MAMRNMAKLTAWDIEVICHAMQDYQYPATWSELAKQQHKDLTQLLVKAKNIEVEPY